MITFNRIFTTERLLQIIVVLAATVAMKLMSRMPSGYRAPKSGTSGR